MEAKASIKAEALIEAAEQALAPYHKQVDAIAFANQRRVLDSFRSHRLSEEYFAEKTGYGIDDAGRDAIDEIFATVVGAEAAAVRMQMVSGTHALACALFGNLLPGERLACLTGAPYDTLEQVIGLAGNAAGSLKSAGVEYVQTDVTACDLDCQQMRAQMESLVSPPTRLAYIQKSCGYSFGRRTLTVADIAMIADCVREINPDCHILVDNCYGEFVEDTEPLAAGASLIAGSLIKNPGGGLAITGGYVAGKKDLVDRALNRLTAPGIGGHLGLTFNQNRLLLQGLFLAPSVVAGAVKGAMLVAEVFSHLGFEVRPLPFEKRGDIIQSIKFGEASRLIDFLKALQQFSPVNAHVVPEPANMPGYEDQVVMAGGTFVEGSTIELSADGPLRPPYAAFVQGGLSYLHVKCALAGVLELGGSGDYRFLKG